MRRESDKEKGDKNLTTQVPLLKNETKNRAPEPLD